jgi:phosphomannomutase
MDEEFSIFFKKFCDNNVVYLATGSDKFKVEEQVPKDILKACMGVFTCMGNELWMDDHMIYSREFTLPSDAIAYLYDVLDDTKYPAHKSGSKNFEYRAGMLNFSTVGRDITQEQREEYYEWDKIQRERKEICDNFNRLFNKHNFYACVGGKISIDIQKQGEDKSQIYHYLSDHDRKIFFGDKCEPGGNDHALASLCEVKFNVDNWRETWDILTNLIIPGQNEKS